jgi:hypothetical protein
MSKSLAYVRASLAVASLTTAWYAILQVPGHDEAAKRIEAALEAAVRLRDSLRQA